MLKDLKTLDFQVKIIDYGLSRTIDPGSVAETPCGTRELVAPELIDGSGYDFRVDVWNLGVIMYMLLTCAVPFQSEQNRDSGIWFIPLKYDISIETMRFLNETMLFEEKLRPFPDQLLKHPYIMTSDVTDARPIRGKLMLLKKERAMCLDLDTVRT